MADTNVTAEWYNGIVDSEVIPTTIAEWKIMIEEYFDVANRITRARSDFKNIEMRQSEKVSTFVDRFKTARLKADIRDDKDSNERLVDGLNEFWTTVLLSDPEYKNLRKKSKYGSEDISKILRILQLDQDQIDKKRSRHKVKLEKDRIPEKEKTSSVKVAQTTAIHDPSRINHQDRLRKGLCHLCGKPGHIRPNCPEMATFLERQQERIASQLKNLKDKESSVPFVAEVDKEELYTGPFTTQNLRHARNPGHSKSQAAKKLKY